MSFSGANVQRWVDRPPSVITNNFKFIGYAKADAADGATVRVWTLSSVVEGLSGLTSLQTCFLREDGTLAATAGTYGREVGTAIGATRMLITKIGTGVP
ncbi:MAG: hypothetical protein B7Z40_15355 [Bosea sp. 12-68-7]|nr:MAG: hypothetical protein B7Z40_15355 [Bosea sp. 12-68-7]